MLFKRIDHIELLTAAPERAVAFYTGVLGFRERERMRIPQTPKGPLDLVYLQLGDTTLEVMCYPEARPRLLRAASRLDSAGSASRWKSRTWTPR
jgi:catechol 2,3-dioxygenase-like lactoylglutathione lyase family enzyme